MSSQGLLRALLGLDFYGMTIIIGRLRSNISKTYGSHNLGGVEEGYDSLSLTIEGVKVPKVEKNYGNDKKLDP